MSLILDYEKFKIAEKLYNSKKQIENNIENAEKILDEIKNKQINNIDLLISNSDAILQSIEELKKTSIENEEEILLVYSDSKKIIDTTKLRYNTEVKNG